MTDELDQILISSSQPDFVDRLAKIRAVVFEATHVNYGSEEDKQLDFILDEVSKRGDEAVVEFDFQTATVAAGTVQCTRRNERFAAAVRVQRFHVRFGCGKDAAAFCYDHTFFDEEA